MTPAPADVAVPLRWYILGDDTVLPRWPGDDHQLEWTPLIKAVALGLVDDVQELARAGAPLEARDWWSRTAWLVALLTGDFEKAQLLRSLGANTDAVTGPPPRA